MSTRAPSSRTRFRSGLDEINYLYDLILYWAYERGQKARTARHLERFRRLLQEHLGDGESIFGEECWSLYHELSGDLAEAIRRREREIELILKLWEVSAGTPGMPVVLERYGIADLADRFDLLATLQHDAGDLDRAIVTLNRSKWLCESFKTPFEGEHLLQDYLYEKNVNTSLMNALVKQGWKLQREGPHASIAPDADSVPRVPPGRRRKRRPDA